MNTAPQPYSEDVRRLQGRVTMLVPTRSRHEYLAALLRMYRGAPLRIVVADSTPKPFADTTALADVDYRHWPGVPFAEKLTRLVDEVDTPYMFLRAENRHISLSGAAACLRALEADPQASLCHGRHFWVRRRGRGLAASDLELLPTYDEDGMAGLTDDDPAVRLERTYAPFTSLYYAVEKTDNWRDILSLTEGIENLNALEILVSAVKAINGKCLRVPQFFSLVQERKSAAAKHPMYDDFSLVVTRPDYRDQYELLTSRIAGHLRARTGMAEADARATVERAVAGFMAHYGPDAPRPEKGNRLARKAHRLRHRLLPPAPVLPECGFGVRPAHNGQTPLFAALEKLDSTSRRELAAALQTAKTIYDLGQ